MIYSLTRKNNTFGTCGEFLGLLHYSMSAELMKSKFVHCPSMVHVAIIKVRLLSLSASWVECSRSVWCYSVHFEFWQPSCRSRKQLVVEWNRIIWTQRGQYMYLVYHVYRVLLVVHCLRSVWDHSVNCWFWQLVYGF